MVRTGFQFLVLFYLSVLDETDEVFLGSNRGPCHKTPSFVSGIHSRQVRTRYDPRNSSPCRSLDDLITDIDLTGHDIGDQGLTVFLEEIDTFGFGVDHLIDFRSLLVKVVGDLFLFRVWGGDMQVRSFL